MNRILFVLVLAMLLMAGMGWCRDGKVDLLNRSTSVFDRESIAFLNGTQYDADRRRTETREIPAESTVTLPIAEPVTGVGDIHIGVTWNMNNVLYATGYDSVGGLYSSTDGVTWTQVLAPGSAGGQSGTIVRIYSSSSGALFVQKGAYLFRSTNPAWFTNANANSGNPANSVLTLDANSFIEYWNWHQNAAGVIMVGQYLTAGTGLKIWRSIDDGATFDLVYTNPAAADTAKSDGIRHSHRVYYHETLGKWVVAWGDGAGTNMTSISDTGDTWTDLYAQGEGHFQPVDLYDYGHATKLLYGADMPGIIGTVDLSSKARENLFTGSSTVFNAANTSSYGKYCFAITKYNGIIYFGLFDPPENIASNARHAQIWATTDLVNFYPVYSFGSNECGVVRFLGGVGGKLHMVVSDSAGKVSHAYMTTPTKKTVTGLAIDPATTNLMNADQSSYETTASTWDDSFNAATIARSTADKLHGTASVKYSGIESYESGVYATSPAYVDYTAGTKYSLQLSAKGIDYVPFSMRFLGVGGTSPYNNPIYDCLPTSKWATFFTKSVTAPASADYIRIDFMPQGSAAVGAVSAATDTFTYTATSGYHFNTGEAIKIFATTTMPTYATATSFVAGTTYYARDMSTAGSTGTFKIALTADGEALDIDGEGAGNIYVCRAGSTGFTAGFYIDCMQVEAGPPTRWQVGGTARAYESLSNTIAFDEIWTNKFTISPYPPYHAYANDFDEQYIKSYWLDANNYINVYWDSGDLKFYVSVVNAGAAAVTYASAKTYKFSANDLFRFALIYDGSSLSLHIDSNGQREVISCTAAYSWLRRLAGTKTGNYAGNAVMSMTLLEDDYYPNRISLIGDTIISDTAETDIGTGSGKSTPFGPGGEVFGN